MLNIENIGTDARTADGLVVLFPIPGVAKLTGVLAVPAMAPKGASLRKLRQVIDAHPRLSVQLEGFTIEPRLVGETTHPNMFEIKFGVRVGMEEVTIPLFLEFLRQCRVITNPMGSDMRGFTASQV